MWIAFSNIACEFGDDVTIATSVISLHGLAIVGLAFLHVRTRCSHVPHQSHCMTSMMAAVFVDFILIIKF